MIVSFKELKSYYKNILIKYYKLSLLEEEKFIINKNNIWIESLSENIYFNSDIILKIKKKNKKNKIINENINTEVNENINTEVNENINAEVNENINTEQNENINDELNENINDELNENINIELNENINIELNENINDELNENINVEVNAKLNENINKKNKNKNKNKKIMTKNINKNVNENINTELHKNINENINENINNKKENNILISINKDKVINIINDNIENINIDSNVIKILKFYYDIKNITIQKITDNKYKIDNKINNNSEYFYYYENKISKISNYYTVLYDGNTDIHNFSLLIQIGNYNTFAKMESYIKVFLDVNVNIYYTIVEEECTDINIKKLKQLTPNCTILKTKNMGMDIGLFIINLLYFRDKKINPKYILKLHTKTDDRFRNNVLNNLCKNKETILKNLKLFENSNNGMITGTTIYIYEKNKHNYDNHINYLHYLSKQIFNNELNFKNLEFAAGTFFYAKFDVFSILDDINLKFLYNKMNNLTTLDINWYKIFYNLQKLSDDEIILNYHNNPKNFGNNLIMQNKTKCLGMRDFMIEHSLERFLGYICKYNNLNIIEV